MLKIAKLTDYGTLVMTTLALEPAASLNAQEIASRSHVAAPTVAKLLKLLVQLSGARRVLAQVQALRRRQGLAPAAAADHAAKRPRVRPRRVQLHAAVEEAQRPGRQVALDGGPVLHRVARKETAKGIQNNLAS